MIKRVLIKLSGEALGGKSTDKYNHDFVDGLLEDLCDLQKQGLQITIVMGAGNILRGNQMQGISQACADSMGMLGTIMNGLFLREKLLEKNARAQLMSSIYCNGLCDLYSVVAAQAWLEEGAILLCAGGTGLPYFTTDTAAVLRARELNCDLVMKGTKVDGVFSADPEKDPNATFYDSLTYEEVLEKRLGVMDLTAIELARSGKLPLRVFSIFNQRPFSSALTQTIKVSNIKNDL